VNALHKYRTKKGVGSFDDCRSHFLSPPLKSPGCYRQQTGT
jgi:hypothetical protein